MRLIIEYIRGYNGVYPHQVLVTFTQKTLGACFKSLIRYVHQRNSMKQSSCRVVAVWTLRLRGASWKGVSSTVNSQMFKQIAEQAQIGPEILAEIVTGLVRRRRPEVTRPMRVRVECEPWGPSPETVAEISGALLEHSLV